MDEEEYLSSQEVFAVPPPRLEFADTAAARIRKIALQERYFPANGVAIEPVDRDSCGYSIYPLGTTGAKFRSNSHHPVRDTDGAIYFVPVRKALEEKKSVNK